MEKLNEPPAENFRVALKSTGKDKFALEEEKEEDKVDFRAALHKEE